jgi:hypothetical protein
MQDLFVFKEVYGSGQGEHVAPLTPDVLDVPRTEAAAALERHFQTLLRRALIAMHTIKPDPEHIHDWLERLLDGLQTFPKSLHQYAELNAEWDPDKVRKYLVEKRFYGRDDVLIRLARDVQRGATVAPQQVVEACEATGRSHSRYARALAKAIDYLVAAGELFDGRIDLDEGRRRFDVGVPELSIQD